MSVSEIARELNLDIREVRQIERQALAKLRQWCKARALKEDDLNLDLPLSPDHFCRFEAP